MGLAKDQIFIGNRFDMDGDVAGKIRISTEKITKRADKIETLDVAEDKSVSNIAEFRQSAS